MSGRVCAPHAVDNEERGRPIAHCILDGTLAQVWSRIVAHHRS
jgi:hypothetical protein